jgi:hypothetical protein
VGLAKRATSRRFVDRRNLVPVRSDSQKPARSHVANAMHLTDAEDSMIESFRDLTVWQKSMVLAERTYAVSRKLPKDETLGLISQLRRVSVSIPSNIAEGKGIGGRPKSNWPCG